MGDTLVCCFLFFLLAFSHCLSSRFGKKNVSGQMSTPLKDAPWVNGQESGEVVKPLSWKCFPIYVSCCLCSSPTSSRQKLSTQKHKGKEEKNRILLQEEWTIKSNPFLSNFISHLFNNSRKSCFCFLKALTSTSDVLIWKFSFLFGFFFNHQQSAMNYRF